MEKGKFIIVGGGGIGLKLIEMLSRDFSLVCIDRQESSLQRVREVRGDSVRTVPGDATSRLVLEKAGVSLADTVVLTTNEEEVNLEVARVLHENFPGTRVLSVGISQAGIEALEDLGVEVEGVFAVNATGLRNRLEHRTKTVHGIGLGKNEILEVEVNPNCRLLNRPLSRMGAKNWHFGLIYRGGNIIVPHGGTTLKAKDKVVILGQPKVLKTVAERLSCHFLDFPLEYGDAALALFPPEENEEFSGEIAYLASTLPLERFIFLKPKGAGGPSDRLLQLLTDRPPTILEVEKDMEPAEAVALALEKAPCNPGLVILDAKSAFASRGSATGGKRRIQELFDLSACPVMLAKGTFPYEKVAIPCISNDPCQNALEGALEISSGLYNDIEALMVKPSPYTAGEGEVENYDRLRKNVSDMALVYKSSIRKVELQGNPIHCLHRALVDYGLMVAEVGEVSGGGLFRNLFRPDVPWRIVRRSPISTLLLPCVEAVL